jgi:hypothetical protein
LVYNFSFEGPKDSELSVVDLEAADYAGHGQVDFDWRGQLEQVEKDDV